ncbi:MAG: hypothetical protein Fur0012_14350 [Elusimicrobiota bacterium]
MTSIGMKKINNGLSWAGKASTFISEVIPQPVLPAAGKHIAFYWLIDIHYQ